eukprot:CAMPEP_0184679624 /NCGR_PEP_ID=MMETSP0312-20130426/2466_1 /TAXON_ID=31354 /ORGANISM="Compsopogon coeruleus, Strain SAG 36.94" /LENGTH=155 /DNA_ID=CAMNT_0027129187 /DNA_START=173 /DNA_END=640 /DNA_ORIENTATION=-
MWMRGELSSRLLYDDIMDDLVISEEEPRDMKSEDQDASWIPEESIITGESDDDVGGPDSRIKLYSRRMSSRAIQEAREKAEKTAQRRARECRLKSGVEPGRRQKFSASQRSARRNELNRNSAQVARERQKAYTESLEDKVVQLERELITLKSSLT